MLFHIESDQTERLIYFGSRVLPNAERHYSQIEKEKLSIIFALKKFQRFIHGRHFVRLTDYCPLPKIFGQHYEASSTTSARLKRWSLFLGSFDYKIAYKKSAKHANADRLSRYPVGSAERIDTEIAGIQQDFFNDLLVEWRHVSTGQKISFSLMRGF